MMRLRKHLRPTLSTLAGIAIASGAVGIIGSGVAACERTIVSTGLCGLGLASAIALSMTQSSED